MDPNLEPSASPPDYISTDHGAPLLEICISFLILETVFMVLLWISRSLTQDQKPNVSIPILMTAGYCSSVAKITLGILMVKIGGVGHHLLTLSPHTIANMLKLNTALQILCPLTTSLSKLGILSLLHQILGKISVTSQLVIKATFILVLLTMIIQVIVPFGNCKPFSESWSISKGAQHSCTIPGLSLWRYFSIPNILTTVIMICIPLPTFYKLQVGGPMKLGLGLVFSVCILGMVAAIMRFYSFLTIKDFHDITYQAVRPLCWTIVESGIYMVAGVLLTLRPLIKKVAKEVHFNKFLRRRSWGLGNRRGKKWGVVLLDSEKNVDLRKLGVLSERGKVENMYCGSSSRNDDDDDDDDEKGVR